ncbi:MAG: SDR family oxidoreductase [Bacteroidetes bacterium]|nr:SDR family oxidoreductase [Bacteroidota bacterium]
MNNDFLEISNKTFLITGATSGIGKSICELLLKFNSNLVICGRRTEKLNEIKNKAPQKVIAYSGDLTDNGFIKNIVDTTPSIDGIVHSAGILKYIPFKVLSRKNLNLIYDINYFAPIELTQNLYSKKKINNDSSIVFISSISGITKSAVGLAAYSSSKSALFGIVKTISIELAKNRIRVNSISPGMVRTEMLDGAQDVISGSKIIEDENRYPLGYGTPEDVANFTAFLLSSRSKWITGSNYIIDGGFSCI